MPIRRSRRIFRPQTGFAGGRRSGRGGQAWPTLLLCLVAILGLGCGAVVLRHGMPHRASGGMSAQHGTVTAAASDVAVVDGDTLRLNQTVLRLHGVSAPARGKACRARAGAPYDCGAAASEALAGIVRGRAVACHLAGRDQTGFAQADCRAGETDVNRAIIAAGWARAATDAAELEGVEDVARAAGRGAWRDASDGSF